jgi:tRNA threonylcarbamoyladenosine biosynthesis protein TsaE
MIMAGYQQQISLYSEADTQLLAKRLGQLLVTGDVVLLSGEIGAGKSFFARAMIQSLQDIPEDVPSPTFTLVQTYITNIGEIWHADLYRMNASSEIDELGLLEAFETAITLVEWPEILGKVAPSSTLSLEFKVQQDGLTRDLTLSSRSADWAKRLEHLDGA